MYSESIFQRHNKGALVTAIGLALSLTACGVVTPPALDKLPGITATPSAITVAEGATTTFDVVLDVEPTANVTIVVESLDITEATIDVTELTFTKSSGKTPWDEPQTVTVSGVNDGEPDGNQAINIRLGIKQVLNVQENVDADYNELAPTNVATTVTDISAAGFTVSASTLATSESGPVGGVAAPAYTVVLNTQPDADVVIDVVSEDISEGTVDKATLTFNALDWQTAQTVTVSSVDDDIDDGNITYNVSMTVNAANTADTTGYADLTLPPVAVTNADNDTAGFTVSATTLGTEEKGAMQSYTVKLNTEPSDSVTVDVTSMNIYEGTVSPATLTFSNTNWSTPQTVNVSPVDDDMADGPQFYDVSMAVSTLDITGYADLTLSPVAVTNADDDTADFMVSETALATMENGTTTSYTVVLNTQPSGNVVIDVVSGNIDEGAVSPSTLTFGSGDWQTVQTVTVTPVDDADVDGDITYDVSMAVNVSTTSDSTGYLELVLDPVVVTNADDDVASGPSSAATPIQVAFTDLPYAGISEDPSSYFEVSGLTAGITYNVTLTQLTGGVDLRVFDDAFTNQACSSIQMDGADESCLVTAVSTSLWIKVDQDSWTFLPLLPGGSFILNLVAQ